MFWESFIDKKSLTVVFKTGKLTSPIPNSILVCKINKFGNYGIRILLFGKWWHVLMFSFGKL